MLKPFKIVGTIVAVRTDAEDNVIGEVPVGELTLYETQFDELRERVDAAWPQIEAAFGAE